jgi:ferredoxin
MKATVDADTCIGCGLCPDICPEVFKLNDENIAEVIADPVPSEASDAAKEACDSCPVNAISIEE